MILSWGKQLEGPKGASNDDSLHDEHLRMMRKRCLVPPTMSLLMCPYNSKEVPKDSKITSLKPYTLPLPFPQMMSKAKLDLQFTKFLKVLKKLYINIPFTETLSQMPSYAKFMKEILSNKRKLEKHKTVALTEKCNAAIQDKLPAKLKNLGSFSIPCLIGNVSINRALCELHSSVSLMLLFMCNSWN